jgi:hypothetical protein
MYYLVLCFGARQCPLLNLLETASFDIARSEEQFF